MPLYHYTDINAVKSILCNKTMWLTDLRYLNDSRELKDGVSVILESLDKWKPTLWTEREFSKITIEYLKDELSSALSSGTHDEIQCTCSFSRSFDQLSQWRAYGNYIVEFDEKALSLSFPKLHNCSYQIKKKRELAIACVTKSIDAICLHMSRNGGNVGRSGTEELINIFEVAATFKDEGFVEENEVRALISTNELDEKVKYRTRGHLLIPFVEQPILLDCINAIHLGPMNNQELAYESLCSLVRKVEKKHREDSGDVGYTLTVNKSSIPYRTL